MLDPVHTIKITDFAGLQSPFASFKASHNRTQSSSTYEDIIGTKIEERALRAAALYNSGDLEGAKKQYRKLLFLDPHNREFNLRYAETLAEMENVNDALIHYKKAQSIQYDPETHQKIYELMLKKGYNLIGNTQLASYLESIDGTENTLETEEAPNQSGLNPKSEEEDPAQGYFVRALAYLSENRKGKAIEELDRCSAADPKNIYAYILKAKIYWNLNQARKGYYEFWQAFEVKPDHPEVKEFLKLVREKIKKLYDQAIKYFWQADYAKSIFFVNKGIEMEPKSVKLLLLRSLIHRKNKRFDQALKDIEASSFALKEFPELEDEIKKNLKMTYNEMGIQMMSRGDHRNAISLFEEALKFKPYGVYDWGIIANKGDCLFKLKLYSHAKDQYNQAYNINPKNTVLLTRLGLCAFYSGLDFFNAKKYYEAAQLVDEALTWDPKNAEYLCFKGKLSMLLKDPKKAFQAYKTALVINPKQKEAQAFMAQFPGVI